MKKEIKIVVIAVIVFLSPFPVALYAKKDNNKWQVVHHDPYATEETYGIVRFDESDSEYDELDRFGDVQKEEGYKPVIPQMSTEGVLGWLVFNSRRAGSSLALSLLSAKSFFSKIKDKLIIAWLWVASHFSSNYQVSR